MEMEHAAVLNFIQRRNLAFFILADDETEEERLADSIFADYTDEHNRAIAPGKGHMDPGYRAKQENIPIFVNYGLLDSFLIDDTRCMNMLGPRLGEYSRLSRLFDAALRARNDFKEKKPDSLRASENITNVYPIQLNPKMYGGLCLVGKISHTG